MNQSVQMGLKFRLTVDHQLTPNGLYYHAQLVNKDVPFLTLKLLGPTAGVSGSLTVTVA